MRGGEAVRDLNSEIDRQSLRQLQAAGQLPFHQFSDQKILAHIVDGNDIGMVQRGYGASFGFETLTPGEIVREFGRQDLQRHIAIQARVARAIDFAHTSGRQARR